MNSTNRAANRLVIGVTGLIILLLGAVALAVGLPTVIRDGWADGNATATRTLDGWLQQTPLGGPQTSWLWLVGLAALVLLAVLLVVFISRQGRGHTSLLLTEPATDDGQTVVESGLAEQVLQDALADRPEFITSNVSTYRVAKRSVLKVSVTCRRGISPQDVTTLISQQLRHLDALLGVQVPALIQVSGGFRARVSRSTRTQ
ncbi:hypothetical protein [Subtercola sp. YIM 133946]|uniref:hypothetical protein n=1 Tax=Subtercola sp. YIM 133946 TaxID=3118909 RepID=UPI002F93248F